MVTNVNDVALDESADIQVDFVTTVRGNANLIVDEIEVGDHYVTIKWADDPDTFIAVVPWSNIKSVNQVV